jgi:hypothetical protein
MLAKIAIFELLGSKTRIHLFQSKLPLFNGRVVAWLVAAEGSVVSQSSHHLHHGDQVRSSAPPEPGYLNKT